MRSRFFIVLVITVLSASGTRAACVNKFTRRLEGSRHVVTLLTGKMTFQNAQALAAAIRAGKAAPLEWVDGAGKTVSRQFGELKVVRPMPVSCDNNPSGVVMIAIFPSPQAPTGKMIVKFGANNAVTFDEQAN